MALNPISFAVIVYILSYTFGFVRGYKSIGALAFNATTFSWFFVSCLDFIFKTLK